MKKLKLSLTLTLTSFLISFGSLGIVAAESASKAAACAGLSQLDSSQTCSDGASSSVTGFVSNAVSILSMVVGIAAVIMVIVAGFKYITASGDSNQVNSAKNTLVYALIGVAVAVLAQFLVHFVFNTTTAATTPPGT